MMKALVTGATGTVGRHIVGELRAAGHGVRALTRDPARADLPDGVEVVAGDLTDPAALAAACDGVDVAHLFALRTDDVDDPERYVAAVLDVVERAGVHRLTVLDGVGAVPLGAAVVAAGGTDVKPVEFMANALWWADAIRADGVVREASPGSPSTVVHEADIAAVAAVALTAGHEYDGATLTVTGPEALTVHERVAILAEIGGHSVRVEEPTRDETLAQWRTWGLDEATIAQFLAWEQDPPEISFTPQDTVERLTGRAGRDFRTWARENAAAFV